MDTKEEFPSTSAAFENEDSADQSISNANDDEEKETSAESLLNKVLSTEESDFRIIISTKNQLNSDYLTKILRTKYDDLEVDTYSKAAFEQKFGYNPPYSKPKKIFPRRPRTVRKNDPSIDTVTAPFFVCQVCGEEVISSNRPEWYVKSRHAFSHLKYDTQLKCYLCGFACEDANPMYKHMPIAHNNKMKTNLYPLFSSQSDADKFNKCVADCFPDTKCLSSLEIQTDRKRKTAMDAMYYSVILGPEKESTSTPSLQFVVPNSTNDIDVLSNVIEPEVSVTAADEGLQLSCGFCDYTTYKPYFMEDHVKLAHSSLQQAACDQCGYRAGNRQLVEDHKKIAHSTPEEKEQTLECTECGYHAGCHQLLIDHMKIAHDF